MDYWGQNIVSMYQIVYLKINILFLLTSLFACSSKQTKEHLPYYNTPDFTPVFLSSQEEAGDKITHAISSFSFTNQLGKKITEKNIEGKTHVANFIFTRCGSICPVMTKHMKLLQDQFGNDTSVVILSYSVTPWADSVPRLKAYAEHNDITAPNWHLLTGNKGDIYKLARTSYYAEEDMGYTKDSTEFLHTEHILLVDKTKKIRGIYNGTLQLEIEQLIKDIKILQRD